LRYFEDKYSVYAIIGDQPKKKLKYSWSKTKGCVISPRRKNPMTAPRIPSNLTTLKKSTQKNSVHKNGALFFS
jgi:hypothetical protein